MMEVVKKTLFILALLLCPLAALAQQGALQGTSTLGGISATTQGAQSSNKLQGVIPAAKISIYLTGTQTLATLTRDGAQSLSNPFYSNASNAVNPGGYVAFASTNQGYDVVASSGQGLPNCTTGPLCYTQPVTLCKDCYPSSQFTVNVGITQITGSNGFNCTGPNCNISGASVALQHNGTALPTQNLLNFLDATPSLPPGYQPVTFSNDGAGGLGGYVPPFSVATGLTMQTAAPAVGTYIKVYPSGVTVAPPDTQYLSVGNLTSANVRDTGCTLGGCSGTGPAQVAWTFTLPSYVNPSNVTAVWASASARAYPTGNNNGYGASGNIHCLKPAGTQWSLFPSDAYGYGPFYSLSQFNTHMTDVTGSQVASVTCTAFVSSSSVVQAGLVVDVPQIYLQLADSIDTAPSANTIQVVPPLYFNQALNTLGISYPLDVVTDTGAANAYVVSNANMSTTRGQTIKFVPAHSSTSTTPTLSLNGIPAATIVGPAGGALTSGDISTAAVAVLIFGPNGDWWLQNPQTTIGSTTVNVNGSPVATPNFNDSTPTAGANGKNVTWQVSSSSVSAKIVGNGTATNYLDGTGNYSTPAGTLPSQYKAWSCQPGLGDGLNAITAGTYLQATCKNTTGVTVTLAGLSCFTDNSGSSTMNAAGNTLGALLTGAVTCTSSFAAGAQSANVALTSGDYIKFTFVSDGTSKQSTWVVTGTY